MNKLVIRLNVTPYNGSAPDYGLCLPRNWFSKSYDELTTTNVAKLTELLENQRKIITYKKILIILTMKEI